MVINNSKKSNNKGSTLIMVLIIVSFIAILGTVCITTAMINFKMKVADKEAKKTFYTDEQAIDEIYNGLGMLSMQILQNEYQAQMSKMIENTTVENASSVTVKITNTAANTNLRRNFTSSMINELTNTTIIWDVNSSTNTCSNTNIDKLKVELNSFIEQGNLAKVKSVKSLCIQKEDSAQSKLAVYTIKFTGCVVEYVNSSGYFSDVTFDGAVALPDVVVKFTQDKTDMLKSFENFALIGNSSIDINENVILNITGGMYAGGSNLNLGASSIIKASDSTIISKKDINLYGAILSTTNSNIWCQNIIASIDPRTKKQDSIITIDRNSKSYIKDDLQIDGDASNVTLSGDYYGYGYEGSANGAENSSAIIANGQKVSVNLEQIQTLVLGGRAYVNVGDGVSKYMTGESLSLKGDQEVYLVPSSLMSNGTSNPYSINSTPTINITRDNFFGYKYLNPTSLYTKVTVGNQVYVYLNFNSEEDSANYFKAILNDSVFNELCNVMNVKNGTAEYEAYKQTRSYMKSILQVNMYSLEQSAIFDKSSTHNTLIYTNGALINADYEHKTVSDVDTYDYNISGTTGDAFVVNSNDLSNRYSLICKILCSPSMYKMTNGAYDVDTAGNKIRAIMNQAASSHDIIIDGKDIDISTLDDNDTFKNIINISYLENHVVDKVDYGHGNFVCAQKGPGSVVVDEFHFPGASIGGIIISEGDVIVKKNFNGLIISRGKIIVAEGVTIHNDVNALTMDAFINSDKAISDYFMAYNNVVDASGNGIGSIAGVTYKDIINFDNWTKTK